MAGIYIHIPFCKSRCQYCDFFSTTLPERQTDYVDALLQEAAQRRDEMQDIRTIYFGGGTPSLLTIDNIERILAAVPSDRAEEITLEANPGDLSAEHLRSLRRIGINRLSIGIQSFNDRMLRLLGRRHNAAQALEALRTAADAGFSNLSADLMYGLPGQSPDDWAADLGQIFRCDIQHLSCYCLSYEENTPFGHMLAEGKITPADDETENRMYDLLCDHAAANGMEHYEVSNFAKPGFRSRHNSAYWTRTPYIGLGAGAHSYDGHRQRRANICDLEQYIRTPGTHTCEQLTDTNLYNERVMLALRTAEGIAAEEINPACSPALDNYLSRGLLRQSGGRIAATRQGLHILNRIIEDLMI